MKSYHISSPLAMAAATISGALSIASLVVPMLDQPLTPAVWLSISMSAGLVLVTIMVGVLAHSHGLMTASGAVLACLAALASLIVVWETSSRRAQVQVAAHTTVDVSAKERERLSLRLAQTEEMLAANRKSQASECQSGKGKRCDGISYTVKTLESAVVGLQTQLKGAPVLAPDAKVERAATVAELTGHDAKAARVWVSLLDPVAVPLLLELVSIVCGVLAFRCAPVAAVAAVSAVSQVAPVSDFSDFSKQNEPEIQEKSEKSAPPEKVATLPENPVTVPDDDACIIVGIKRLNGTARSQHELAVASGLSDAELSKRLRNSKLFERVREDNRNVVRLRA